MAKSNKITQLITFKDLFKETKLWAHLEKTEKDHIKIAQVDDLIDYALPLLDRIVETFPTYTLHNGQHQLNILNRMSDLLGKRINTLTSLETVILILGSFFHDIGMVFSDPERDNLKNEYFFDDFLNKNPAAKLSVSGSTELSVEIAEWYCRWIHAKRVWVYLDRKEDKLIWDGLNLKKGLGEVCVSHNEDITYLKDDDKFATSFWEVADLRFCAILLRLADILDFDHTRSPKSVFEYLNLDNPETYRNKISHAEWKKHLASKGFMFTEWNAVTPYEIDFRAAPTHPAVENDIREFLDTIEQEFQKCSSLIKFCSDRWKNFALPDKIKRNNIRAQGYKYGNYKFSLDQEQILNLLMGENLYDDHFVFIRELIQNSIDTSRDREFHEHKNGNINFKSKPIEVSTWIDIDGYRWVKVDDYGMGMTEDIINKFFLKVGNSYYNSDEFKVRKLEYKNLDKTDFTPISRFGIGILSCFIAGDLVEVSTRSISSDNQSIYPIRLSLKGLHNYYIMQTSNDTPLPMPIEEGSEKGYRIIAGTSIAVRIRMDKDKIEFDAKNILKKNILNSPIKVLLKGFGSIGNYPEIIANPLCKSHSINLTSLLENFLHSKFYYDFQLEFMPIDITRASATDNLKGQAVVILLKPIKKNSSSDGQEEFKELSTNYSWYLSYTSSEETKHKKSLTLKANDSTIQYSNRLTLNLTNFLDDISLFGTDIPNLFEHTNIILSHNGIVIPNIDNPSNTKDFSINLEIKPIYGYLAVTVVGIIELSDDLRPDLSISRNKLININWNLWSHLNYSLKELLYLPYKAKKNGNFASIITRKKPSEYLLYNELLKDNLITDKQYWPSEPIISTNWGRLSIIKALENQGELKLTIDNFSKKNSLSMLIRALLQKYCFPYIKIISVTKHDKKLVNSPEFLLGISNIYYPELELFPPLTFIKYEDFNGLTIVHSQFAIFLNIDHSYSKWLIKSVNPLYNNFPIHYWTLLQATDINTINITISRLRNLLPEEFKPPVDLIISNEDIMSNLLIG
jgi:hypothetical protein